MKKPNTYQEYVWVVAYINSKFVSRVDKELSKFVGIESRIPTVKVLKKNFKKEAHYEEVPLLFNYGFFRIPKSMALNAEFMAKIKDSVSCIVAWVKDPTKETSLGSRKTTSKIATCTYEELLVLYQETEEESLYSDKDVETLKPNDEVIMRGYPFDGIKAKIIKVNKQRREVEVEISTFGIMKSVKVQYENLMYNIYIHKGGYDDSLSNHISLDELAERKTVDRAYKYNQDHE
jgi:transcription antitermination factor NusG